jgi:4-hydroxythreonine-4-phosphate dehydrogenase
MPISPSNKPLVALSMGDPSGIGPEIILKALVKPAMRRLANYIIIGDAKVLKKTAVSLGKPRSFSPERYASLLDLKNVPAGSFSFGKERAVYGKASVEYIKKAFGLIKANMADCLVTAPINKSAAKKAGFKFPGHTEYLASLSGARKFVMMLVGGPLRVSLVTRHIPISQVPRRLSSQNISETIKITLNALKRDFNISRPRIGVCALNPHSGEGGIFGREEHKTIIPAVKKFRKGTVVGPLASDALFYDAYRGRFDGVICLYHDQGLIPLKMIARDSGVNVTLGLKLIRTSPDHGTAFDIAGKGKADPRSMEAAIRLAVSMTINRRKSKKSNLKCRFAAPNISYA